MRLRPSEITTECCSASVNTSTMLCCMGKSLSLKIQWIFRQSFSAIWSAVLLLFHCTPVGPFSRLQDISCGYWVLVLHFTRREAVRQIDELQHIATNLGRSKPPFSHSRNLDIKWNFKQLLFCFLFRSGVVIPSLEWELFRELSAPLSGEPSFTAQVLFQVSYSYSLFLHIYSVHVAYEESIFSFIYQ